MTRILAVSAMLGSCNAGSASNRPQLQSQVQTNPEADNAQAKADVANVLGTIERMTEAFNRGDLDGIMATYEDPATVVFEPGTATTTSAQVRAGFEQFLSMKPKFRFSAHEVYVAGDLAVHHTPWTMRGKGPDGVAMQQHGLSVAVLRRQPDGSWLIAIDNPHGQRLVDTVGFPE